MSCSTNSLIVAVVVQLIFILFLVLTNNSNLTDDSRPASHSQLSSPTSTDQNQQEKPSPVSPTRNENSQNNNNNKRTGIKKKTNEKKFTLSSSSSSTKKTTLSRKHQYITEDGQPLRCDLSSSMEESEALIHEFGPVQENWCELVTTIRQEDENVARNIFSYSSAYSNDSSSTKFTTGSSFTEYDFRGPKNAKWPFYQCPIKHEIRCNNNIPPSKKKQNNNNKSRALVLFAVPSNSYSYMYYHEMNNLKFFLRHGLIEANTPTALFDEVDFVFTKIQLDPNSKLEDVTGCGEMKEVTNNKKYSNVRFVEVPSVPCDLCAHTKVLEYLGVIPEFDSGEQNNNDGGENSYDQIIFLNSGTRGPFYYSKKDHDDDDSVPPTTWIDFVAMAGRRKIPNPRSGFFKEHSHSMLKNNHNNHDCPTHVMSSTSISWYLSVHPQSYFLSMPYQILRKRIYPLFSKTCPKDGGYLNNKKIEENERHSIKHQCILSGEVPTGNTVIEKRQNLPLVPLLNVMQQRNSHKIVQRKSSSSSDNNPDAESYFAIHSLAKQFYVQNLKEDTRQKNKKYYNPNRDEWIDPCHGVFVKFGGLVYRKGFISQDIVHAVNKLTIGMDLQRKKRIVSKQMKQMKQMKQKKNKNNDNENDDSSSSVLLEEASGEIFPWEDLMKMFKKHGCEWEW